ncbi:30S ribosomal protein S9 [Candidatus Woesearchaeota archaeon]|nr:MAG: 30S ribosomal protein S9 [Candidatus Woesearchaeota archaeon]
MSAIHQSGTRKRAVARATLTKGTGIVRINRQALSSIPKTLYRSKIEEPLLLAGDAIKKINISVNVFGGGINSQADAIRTAIAKSLAEHDKKLKKLFLDYDRSLLVPDVRRKETHKPGNHGKARASRQTSYR